MNVSRTIQLKDAIGYPDPVPDGASSFVFRVDGFAVEASDLPGGILRLVCPLDASGEELPQLADWATGRILRDDATLSVSPSGEPFLWREIPAGTGPDALRRAFETFLDACDWWRARLDERSSRETARFPEVVIRP